MIYGLLLTFFVINCFALILIVLMQKGKGSMGLGTMGGGTTMLFGGSGGQDFFQKLTWAMGAILMGGSLLLGLMKSSYLHNVRYINVQEQNLPAKTELELPEASQKPASEQKAAETTEQKNAPVKSAETKEVVQTKKAETPTNKAS